MSVSKFQDFTINSETKSLKVSSILYAMQRYVAGKHNDTVLVVINPNTKVVRNVYVSDTYSQFLAKGLNQFMDLIWLDQNNVESPVAINVYNITDYVEKSATETLVFLGNKKRFRIKASLSDFIALFEKQTALANIDFENLPDYPNHTAAADDTELAQYGAYRLDGSEPDAGDPKTIYVKL